MNHPKHCIVIAALVIIAACNNKKTNTDTENSLLKTTTHDSLTKYPVSDGNTAPGTIKSATGVALNPAHGQPGHRCDISVGAPLNSPANKEATITPAAPQIVPQPQQQPTQSPVSTSSKAGLNPAHGQPGHRCDISVGAPLNSKP